MFTFIKKFFIKQDPKNHPLYKAGLKEGRYEENKRIYDQKAVSDLFEIESKIGKPVYTFGNEWEDPIIGVVVGVIYFNNRDVPFEQIYNFITKEITIATCKTYYYNKFKFDALYKLNPYERWNLIKDTNGTSTVPITNKLLTKEEVEKLLLENGFFDYINKTKEDIKFCFDSKAKTNLVLNTIKEINALQINV